MDPSILLRSQPQQQFADPLELYGRALSLRQLIDQGQVRRQQIEAQQLAMQQTRRNMAEQERFDQNIGTLPENATLQQVVSAVGARQGIPYFRQQRQAQTAGIQQERSQFELNQLKRNLAVNRIAAVLREPDPEKRQAAFRDANGMAVDLGLMTPEAAAGPLDEDVMMRLYTQARGPEEAQKFQSEIARAREDRAKAVRDAEAAARKQSQDQLELAGHYAGTVVDQPSYERLVSMLPKESRQLLPREYSPTAMRQLNNMTLTAQQRAQLQQDSPGEFIRTVVDPNATPEEKSQAGQALALFREQATAAAPRISMTPDQRVGNESQLRGDFRQESRNYVTIRDAFNRMQSAARDNTGPGDMSLLYGYMRLLDPTSTIRESEFQMAQNAGSIPESIRGQWLRAINGQRLDPNVRQQFMSEARQMYSQTEADYRQMADTYRGIARRSNLDPENVVVNYSPATPPPRPPAAGQPAAQGAGPAPRIPLSQVLTQPAARGNANTPAGPAVPAVGSRQMGTDGIYRFKGGDPNVKENWEKVR